MLWFAIFNELCSLAHLSCRCKWDLIDGLKDADVGADKALFD